MARILNSFLKVHYQTNMIYTVIKKNNLLCCPVGAGYYLVKHCAILVIFWQTYS